MNEVNYLEAWNKVIKKLSENLKTPSIKLLFEPLSPSGVEGENFIVNHSEYFQKDFFEEYVPRIEEILSSCYGKKLKLKLIPAERTETIEVERKEDSLEQKKKTTFLNPRYTFENFVVGNNNKLCHAAAMAIAESPGKCYNPFFIYGGVGLGKTHITQAIGHYVAETHPNFIVKYATADSFMNEIVQAIHDNKILNFRNKYRKCEVLLIDDIQFIHGERTQEEFFYLFNALYESEKQIVITSDRLPNEIPNLEERLISRFGSGLITDIQPPDLETRIAILKKKIPNFNLSISNVPDNVIFYIASNITTNVRDLESALTKVVATSEFTKQPITLDFAKEVLKHIIKTEVKFTTSISEIFKAINSYFNISINDLKAKRRSKDIVIPRQIGMYLAKELTDLTYERIGEDFGGKDHSTVIHSWEKIRNLCQTDALIKSHVENLIKIIKKLS